MDKIEKQKAREFNDPVYGWQMWSVHLQRTFVLTTLLKACVDFNRVSEFTPTEMKVELLRVEKKSDSLVKGIKDIDSYVQKNSPEGADKIQTEMNNDRIWDLCNHIDLIWNVKNIAEITELLRKNMITISDNQ